MYNLSRFPSLKTLLPMLLGIVLGVVIHGNFTAIGSLWACGLLFIALAVVSYLIYKKSNTYLITFLLVIISIGYSYMSCSYTNANYVAQTTKLQLLPTHKYYYTGIIKELAAGSNSLKINLTNVTVLVANNKQVQLQQQQLVVYVKNYTTHTLQPNDTLCMHTAIQATQVVTNPFAINLSAYYKYHGIGFSAFAMANNVVYVGKSNGWSFGKLAYSVNQKLFGLLKLHLTNDELAITTAMLLGNDNYITNDTLNDYKATGLMHILSVSGMHVALIYGGLMWLLALCKINTRRTIWVNVMCLLFIWLYICIIGSPIAAVRSAFMISFLILARITRNESNTLNALIASATLLLLYNPLSLMDIGFQLSYMAILGIVILNPLLKKKYTPTNKPMYYLWELVTVSIAAQAFTTPLLLYYSHTFSNYFLISNVLCIGLSEIIMYCAIVVMCVSPIPYLGFGGAYILAKTIALMNMLTNFIAQLPHAVSYIYTIDAYSVLLCYLVLALGIALIITKQKQYFIYTQLAICALLFYMAQLYYTKLNKCTIVAYSHKNGVGIYAQNKNCARLYYTSLIDDKLLQQIKSYNQQNNIQHFEALQIVNLPNYKLKKITLQNKLNICNTKYAALPNSVTTVWFNNKYYNPTIHAQHLVANGYVTNF